MSVCVVVSTGGDVQTTHTENPTMQRCKFVIGLGALASGAVAAVGTGAFSSLVGTRPIPIPIPRDTASDADAFLSLQERQFGVCF